VINTAIATADTPLSGADATLSVTSNEAEVDIAPIPSIAITKTSSINQVDGNTTIDKDDEITYTIVVTNTGNTALTGINITDTLTAIGGASLSLDSPPAYDSSTDTSTTFPSLPTLQIGEAVTYTATFTITQPSIDAGGVSNTASVVGYDPDGEAVNASIDSAVVNNITQIPDIEVTKTASVTHVGDADVADRVVRADDIINYSVTITNTGNVTLTDLAVVDALTDGAGNDLVMTSDPTNQWTIASLAPGAAQTYTLYYTIGSAAALTGSISNIVTVTGDTPKGTDDITAISDDPNDTTSDQDPTVVETDLFASITVTKKDKLIDDGDDEAGAGDLIEYTVVVKNTGEVTVTDIELEDNLRSGNNTTIYLSSPNHTAGDLTPWPSFSLAAGESRELTGFYILSQATVNTGSVSNFINATAKDPNGNALEVRSDDPDTSLVNDDTVTSIAQSASVLITKTASPGSGDFEVGDVITYTIKVKNTGNSELNGVVIDDELSDLDGNLISLTTGPTFTSSSLGASTTFTADPSTSVATLQVGEEVTFTATFTVTQPVIDTGGVSNIASVTATADDANNTAVSDEIDDAEVTLINAEPSLEVTKTAIVTDDGDTLTGPGDTIEYTITVTNTGNVSLTGVNIVDTMVDDNGNALTLTSPASWNAVDIEAKSSYDFIGSYAITDADRYRKSIINTAIATGYDPSNKEVTDETDSPTTVSISADPSIEVTKAAEIISDGNNSTQLGDVIQYTISIINTGNTALAITDITDTLSDLNNDRLSLSSAPRFVSASKNSAENSLAIQETATYIATFIINQDAIDAGGVSNVATVTVETDDGNSFSKVSDDPSTTNISDDPTITSLTQTSGLEVIKTAAVDDNGDGITGPGDTINYTITVENTGNVTLTGVYVDDDLTAIANTATLARLLTTEPKFDAASLTSTEGTLKVGEVATYTATYLISNDDFLVDQLSNSVTAYGNDPDGITVNDTNDPSIVEIDANPSFTVTKEVTGIQDEGDGYNGIGDIIDYTITITNTGNVALINIGVVDMLVDGDDTSTTLTPTYDTTNTATEGTLQVGETATYSVQFTIDQATSDSELARNTVTVTADDPTGNEIEESAFVDTQTGASASMEALKTWTLTTDVDNDGVVDEGDTITFTIEVQNTGNIVLNSVGYQDTLRDGNDATISTPTLTFVSADLSTTDPTVLLAGETATYTFTYTVTADAFATGLVSNQVTFYGVAQGQTVSDISDDPNNPTSNESDPTVVPMGSDPSMMATKTVRVLENGDGLLGVGDAIEYTIIVENNGNAILSDVNIHDNNFIDDNNVSLTLTTGPTFTISSEGSDEGTLIPGEKAHYIATFALTQSVIDAGGLSNQATVYASSPGQTNDLYVDTDDPDTSAIEDATALQIDHDPVIEVVKTATVDDVDADGKTNIGDTITYTITVENKGNVTLDGITLEDILTDAAGNTSTLTPIFDGTNTASEGTLEVGERATYTLIYTVSQSALDSGQVMNTVLVTASSPKLTDDVTDRSDDGDDSDGDTDDDQTITPLDQSPSISVTKVATVDKGTDNLTNLGDTITYTITIENTGDVSLSNILVTDVLTDGNGATNVLSSTYDSSNTATEGTLAVGESATYTVEYTIDQGAVNSGSVSNNATATASSPTGVQISDALDSLVVTTIDQTASLEVIKLAEIVDNGNGETGVGDIVQYTITVKNTGSVTLTSISVTDELQDNAGNDIVLSSGNTLSYTGASQGSPNGTLQANEVATYTAYHVIDQSIVDAGGLTNSALAIGIDPSGVDVTDISDDGDAATDGPDADTDPSNDPTVTTISPSPSMSVVKTAELVGNTDGITEAGDLVEYTIVVTNAGNVTLLDVEITDVLTDQSGNGLTLTQDAAIDGVLRDIAPGASETYTVTYLIEQAAADSGSISNVASASATILDGSAVTPVDSDPAIVTMTANPSMSIQKTKVENDGVNDQMDVGETIDYTIVITNTGNITLNAITFTEILTDGNGNQTDLTGDLTLVAINDTATTDTSVTSLAVGDKATYTVSYTVTQTAMNSGQVTNVATVTGSTPAGTTLPIITSEQVVTLMGQEPAMTVTKTATENDNNDGLDLGETITYTIVVENTGNVELTDVVVTDNALVDLAGESLSLTDGPTFSGTGTFDGILSVSETVTYTATFTVDQQAINAGGLSNTASATATTPAGDSISEDSNAESSTISAIARLEVAKTYVINDNGDGVDGLGDFVEYTISVENTGDIALENLSIEDIFTDNVSEELTFTLDPFFVGATANSPDGSLKVDETATYKAYFVITQQAVDAGGLINNVTATAFAPGSTTPVVDQLDTPTITLIAESPEMEVIKTAQVDDGGDGSIDIGDTINYTIRVTNTGNVSLENIVLVDSITDVNGTTLAESPLTTTHLASSQSSAVGSLAVGEVATYTTSYVVTQEAIDAGGVMNSITATADSPAGNSINDKSDDGDATLDTDADTDSDPTNDPTVTTIDAAPALTVVKVVANITDNPGGTPDGYNGTGDEVEYSITVKNEGNVTLTLSSLTDTISDALGTDVATLTTTPAFTAVELAVQNEITYTATYVITSDVADTKLVRNTVVVTATPPSGSDVEASDIADVSTGADADLEVTKTWVFENDLDSNNIANVGDKVKFIITVKNTGNVTLTDIGYDDTFLDGSTPANLLSFDPPNNPRSLEYISADNGTLAHGTLKAGETATYHAYYTITQEVYDSGEATNTVTFYGDIQGTDIQVEDVSDNGNDFDGNTSDDVTRITMGSFPSAEIIKVQDVSDTNGDGMIGAGDTVDYTITIENTGNITLTWTDGDIIDTLSDESNTPIPSTPSVVWSDNNRGSPKGTIVEGETALFTLAYILTQSDVDGGILYNRVEATLDASGDVRTYYFDHDNDENNDADGDGTLNNDALILNIEAKPDVEITKTASPPSGVFKVGDNITYTVEIINTGNVTLDDIVFTDILTDGDGNTTDLSSALTLTQVNGLSQTSLTNLDVGDTATYQAIYAVDQAAIDSGRVENMVSVTALTPSDTAIPVENIDSPVVTSFTQTPAISLTKSATPNPGADGNLDAGDTITYDLALTNDGNVTLQSIELTDILSHTSGGRTELLTPIFVDATASSLVGILKPEETANYTVEYTVTQDAINAGGVSNQATAEAITPSGITISAVSDDPSTLTVQDDPTITSIIGVLDLEVLKTATIQDNGDGLDGVGDVVQYTITVENTGNLTLDVTLVDELEDLKGNATPLTSGTSSLSTVRSIDPGSIETYIVYKLIDQAIVDAGGLTNTATATGVVPDGRSVSDASDVGDIGVGDTDDDPTITTIAQDPQLTVTKTATIVGNEDGFVGATDVIDYTIRVTNTGNVTIKGVELTDTLTDGNGNALNIDTSAWLVRDIAPGQTEIYTAFYVIEQTAADSGSIINTVTATGAAPDGSNVIDISDDGDTGATDTGKDPTVIEMDLLPSIEVIKTAVVIDNNGDGKDGIGDTIEYTITVENTGNTDLTGLSFVDTFTDLNGDIVNLSSGPNYLGSDMMGGSPTTLRINEMATFQATFVINQQAVNAGGVSNTIMFIASSPGKSNNVSDVSDDGLPSDADVDGDSTNDPTITQTDPNPAMEVIKTAFVNDNGDSLNGAGDIIRYTIEVENTGDIVLNNVFIQNDTLTDGNGTLLALSSGPDYWQAQTVEVGQTAVFTALYVISQEAAQTGYISNTAKAVGSSPGKANDVNDISDDDPATDGDGDGDFTNDPTIVLMDAPPVSSIEVTKEASVIDNDGDNNNSLGDTINYTITVANTGNTDLRDVVLDDVISDLNGDRLTLTSGPNFVSASLVSIEGKIRQGEFATYTASFIINQQAIDAGGVSNTVTAIASSPGKTNDIFDISDDGDDTDGNTENDPTVTLTSGAMAPAIEVTKTAIVTDNGDGTTGLSDTINYTITISNNGDTALTNVKLVDEITDLNGGLLTLTSGPVFVGTTLGSAAGSLAVGESATYNATFIINNQAVTAGGVSNTATATATSPTGTMVSDISDDGDDSDGNTINDPTLTIIGGTIENPSVEVTKTAFVSDNGDGVNGLGDTIIYTITVANTGDSILSNVNLNDSLTDLNGAIMSLTSGPIFINASLGSGLGTLAIGEVANYRATFTINNQAVTAGGVSNTATATATSPTGTMVSDISDDGDDTDGNTTNDPTITTTSSISESPSIEVTKSATINDNGDGVNGLGDTIIYTIRVANTGDTILSNVNLNDSLTDLNGAIMSLTNGPIFINASLGSAVGTLAIGEVATYRATFSINNQAVTAGGVSNTATATAMSPTGTMVSDISDDGDDSDGNMTNDPTITITNAVPPVNSLIEVTKTATISDNGNGATGLGDTITFLITVENTGTTTLNGLFIDDVFSDLSGNLLTLTTGPLFVSANIGSTEGSLIAGEIATYTATFVINAQADNAGGVSNTASATATDPTGNTVVDVSDDGDDKDGNTTNDPTVLVFSQNPIDGDFEVFTGMSPGDDGVNDYFKIAGIEKYPNNKVSVFNRWGVLVYEAKGYGQGDRLFMGISEGRITITKNQKLPTGTYFYVIEFEEENPGRETYTGYLYINRD
jgi:gliding motility-associated-like protein/uncharacterized repeat protein (TIGR01451 family)